jgi:hypothetical protein
MSDLHCTGVWKVPAGCLAYGWGRRIGVEGQWTGMEVGLRLSKGEDEV